MRWPVSVSSGRRAMPERLTPARWLVDLLIVVEGFARGEHEGPDRKLSRGHACVALDQVPPEILKAAGVAWTVGSS